MGSAQYNPAALMAAASGDFENAIVASTPGGIEAQEKAGQTTLVACNAQLPKRINGATREQMVGLGFVFGEDVDELFVACKFPEGWRLRATDHAMHSDLLDANGSIRGLLFYKAAFYDRKADLTMVSRFHIGSDYAENDGDPRKTYVCDRQTGAREEVGECGQRDWSAMDALEAKARQKLDAERPGWRDAMAYWGQP